MLRLLCPRCHGQGTTYCLECHGTGKKVTVTPPIGNCEECGGTGRRHCDVCNGTGGVDRKLGASAPPIPDWGATPDVWASSLRVPNAVPVRGFNRLRGFGKGIAKIIKVTLSRISRSG